MKENSVILQDNLLYLNAWLSHNQDTESNIQIHDGNLIWNHDNTTEKVSLEEFYLPTLLYNQSFQRDLQMNVLTPLDLFRIIRVHVYTMEYCKEKRANIVFITDFYSSKDEKGQEIIFIKNSLGKHFIIRNQIEKVKFLYKNLKSVHEVVDFVTFQKELEKI